MRNRHRRRDSVMVTSSSSACNVLNENNENRRIIARHAGRAAWRELSRRASSLTLHHENGMSRPNVRFA